jgi:hypothetical protein
LLHHAHTGARLYTNDYWTFTRCQEKVNNDQDQVIVGGFSSEGLCVYRQGHDDVFYDYRGVSCLLKF